jgi:YD repeat-containing protein
MNNCAGCGTVLDPTEEEVNAAVDGVLHSSIEDAHQRGGVCPLCGHSKEIPPSHRKSVQFALLVACLAMGAAVWFSVDTSRQTRRMEVARDAMRRLNASALVTGLLGKPIRMQRGVTGTVQQDETGWQEARLTIPVDGPGGSAVVRIAAGRASGAWTYSTFEVVIEKEHKKVDLIAGRVITYDGKAYVEVHTLPPAAPAYMDMAAPAPRMDGTFPCVAADVTADGVTPRVGKCTMPVTPGAPVDRFEADLRYGRFVMRETDLAVNDVFQVPLTRTYSSNEWVSPNHMHAFGWNTNHPWDLAPLGTRNPYTYQLMVLADGDSLYFPRVSSGTGYADAVFQHAETSTRFYRAIDRWNGHGWTLRLADGSTIEFPESYNAKNMAQGAATEMRDAAGNRLELVRDGQRNLEEIRTPHGHWIRFHYDGRNCITRAEDDAGEWAQYTYNGNGLLTDVALSTGRKRRYAYQGRLMTQVTDEHGQSLVTNWYSSQGNLELQRFGNEVYSYRYQVSPSRTYFSQTDVTLPDGTVQTVPTGNAVPGLVENPR